MARTRILSWDCAYKTLGWATITVNTGVRQEVATLLDEAERAAADGDQQARTAALLAARDTLKTWFVIESLGVDDVLGGRKVARVKTVDRARALRDYLVKADHKGYDTVLIEGQPPAISTFTGKSVGSSTVVGQQLVAFYLDQNSRTIAPGKKNRVVIAPHLEFSVWAGGRNSHALRKEHAVASVEYVIPYMSPTALAQYQALPAGDRNHTADAIMQAVAYLPTIVKPLPSVGKPVGRRRKV